MIQYPNNLLTGFPWIYVDNFCYGTQNVLKCAENHSYGTRNATLILTISSSKM